MNYSLYIYLAGAVACAIFLIIEVHDVLVHIEEWDKDRQEVLDGISCDRILTHWFTDEYYFEEQNKWLKEDQKWYDKIEQKIKECEN